MSGGSWNYAYSKIHEVAEQIEEDDVESLRENPLRFRLVVHLKELSELMHLIEWCDSGDKGADEWIKPAQEFFDRIKEAKNKC